MFLLYESLSIFIGLLGIYFFKHKKSKKTFFYFSIVMFNFALFISCPISKEINFNGNAIETEFEDFEIFPKESGVPSITIVSPVTDQFFNETAPSFIVEISDPDLDKMWYTLNLGTQKYIFDTNDTISDWLTLSDGVVTLTFFANDS
ncbi:MAG: hypothetical protein JSV23_01805, partial [Promethearchaeota archaeon]